MSQRLLPHWKHQKGNVCVECRYLQLSEKLGGFKVFNIGNLSPLVLFQNVDYGSLISFLLN